MKNYELISELEKLPAGAEVRIECICEQREVTIEEDSDDGEYYVVSKGICCAEYDKGMIMLS